MRSLRETFWRDLTRLRFRSSRCAIRRRHGAGPSADGTWLEFPNGSAIRLSTSWIASVADCWRAAALSPLNARRHPPIVPRSLR